MNSILGYVIATFFTNNLFYFSILSNLRGNHNKNNENLNNKKMNAKFYRHNLIILISELGKYCQFYIIVTRYPSSL